MYMVTTPVANGVFPRPDGGYINGVFAEPGMKDLLDLAVREGLFLAPLTPEGYLYPVGVRAIVVDAWRQPVYVGNPPRKVKVVFARVKGAGHVKASRFTVGGGQILALDVEPLDIEVLREGGYPVISAAGWRPTHGETLMNGVESTWVRIYGEALEDGQEVAVQANLSGLVSPELAHTIEHAIIRSLRFYALCTVKTLRHSLQQESEELKTSLEVGFRFRLPEVFGVTKSGACGNPLTNLVHFHLHREFLRGLEKGLGPGEALQESRRLALSKVTEDLNLSSEQILRNLKIGMWHEDEILTPRNLAKILARFPADPWS